MHRPVRLFAKSMEERITPDTTPHNIAVSNFYQNWNTITLITANDDWSGVPSVVGFLGDDTFGEGVDPQTILTPYSTVDVIANQGINTSLTTGGVAEFDGLSSASIALQADAAADAPNLVISINTTGFANITISYTLRDIDGTADEAIQPVALQYRIGNAGDFINVPAGFVADATGPAFSSKITPVSATLPIAVDNQALVQFRVITTNAAGNDEWVGVDNIVVGSKEFVINTYTTGNQLMKFDRAVAMDADGDAFVVWQSYAQDGSFDGIYGQRFDAAGMKVGGEFRVNTFTTSFQEFPSVAVDFDGDAFVVWASDSQDGSNSGIYGQRFNAAGIKVGPELRVNTYTDGTQHIPSVAVDANGNALVIWTGRGKNDSDGIYGQRFDAGGIKVGPEFQVNTYTTLNQYLPSVAMGADGDSVVTWEGYGDGSFRGIYGQRFDAAGMKVGGEIQINTYTTNNQRFPSVAMDTDGDTFVTWASLGQDGGTYHIYGQRYNAEGMKVGGGEFPINTNRVGSQTFPMVALDANGDAFVTWEASESTGVDGIYGQRFDVAGMKVGPEFQVNTYATSYQTSPSVALDASGDAFVVWQSEGQDGSKYGVYGQRFRSISSPITISNLQINDGSLQRSLVTSLQITFDSPVSFAGSSAAAFSLVNQMTSNAATLSAAVDPSGTAVTLTFTGGSVDLGGSLSDGRYTLTIIGSQFTGNGFDANGDGITGDNYVLVGTPANSLFRLFGDSDGNGSINSTDFATFRTFFGIGPSFFDFNNDGQTNSDDFAEFRKRFGLMV